MSLYNLVHGVNAAAGTLLHSLGIGPGVVPRFRDCYLTPEKQIVILTRTGGGNREYYTAENQKLRELPGYVSDKDDDFDSTFALFTYNPPEHAKGLIDQIFDAGVVDGESLEQKTHRVVDSLKASK